MVGRLSLLGAGGLALVAALACQPHFVPVDAAIVGIIDHIDVP